MNEAHGQDYDATQHIGAIDEEEIRVMVDDGLRSLRKLAVAWTPQMALPSPEQTALEDAVIAWLNDIEEIDAIRSFNGPYMTATDRLQWLARKVRDYRSGR